METKQIYDLLDIPLTQLRPDNHILVQNQYDAGIIYGYVNSDWGRDKSYCRYNNGVGIMFAGAIIAYFSKHQCTIPLSSTEE